mmetsp:Transcript_115460/g.313429  ORF Transcript_115460/g.313429 Transcript_115460/m.313429 type:complete len:355 (+) Transcript_115460:936-2000(+)
MARSSVLLDEVVNRSRSRGVGVRRRCSESLPQGPGGQRVVAAALEGLGSAVGEGRRAREEHAGVVALGAGAPKVDHLHAHAVMLLGERHVSVDGRAHWARLPRSREPQHAHRLLLHARLGGQPGDDPVDLRPRLRPRHLLPLHELRAELLEHVVGPGRRRHRSQAGGGRRGRLLDAALPGAVVTVRAVRALAPGAAGGEGAEGRPATPPLAQRGPSQVLGGAILGVRAVAASAQPAAGREALVGRPPAEVVAAAGAEGLVQGVLSRWPAGHALAGHALCAAGGRARRLPCRPRRRRHLRDYHRRLQGLRLAGRVSLAEGLLEELHAETHTLGSPRRRARRGSKRGPPRPRGARA